MSINTFETEIQNSEIFTWRHADAANDNSHGGWPQRPTVKFTNIVLLKIASQSIINIIISNIYIGKIHCQTTVRFLIILAYINIYQIGI